MTTSQTKYVQLQEALKAELLSGKFRPGDRFYTEKEIMEKYGMSCVTVARALKEMTAEGYFERRRKLGTFVRSSRTIPGMTGEVMTRPLYLIRNTEEKISETESFPSWFLVEKIRSGIINNYPGMVKIVDFEEFLAIAERKKDILSIVRSGEFNLELTANEQLPQNTIIITLPPAHQLPWNSIRPNFMIGVVDAMTHLIQSGHKKIAFAGGENTVNRYAGYRIALESFNLPLIPELVFFADTKHPEESGRAAARDILALPAEKRPTAIFCATDKLALAVMKELLSSGIRIPEDISVAGFDDIEEARRAPVPLSTVHVPYTELGKCAVEALLHKLRTGENVPSKNISTEFIMRKSTGPVKH